MDYEKKYKEALELARVAAFNGHQSLMEGIFPELKESEDERIRKELIAHCRNTRCVTEEGAEKIAKWIAWLEKQGKKNSVTTKEEEKVREQVVYAINKLNVPGSEKNKLLAWLEKQDPKKHEEELEKAYKTADKVQYRRGYEAAMKEMEKQGEQKSDYSNKEKLMLDDIIEATERSNIFMEDYQRELVDWLKSLEQRIGGEP